MNYGNQEIGQVFYGGAEIERIYHGSDLVYEAQSHESPYQPGEVILEKIGSTTGWTTGTFTILEDTVFDVIAVSPGGGGASGKWSYASPGGTVQARSGAASGGSGGAFVGKVRMKAGEYSYQIPENGKGIAIANSQNITVGDLLIGPIYMSGGGNAYKVNTIPAGGMRGQHAISTDDSLMEIVSYTTNADGTAGSIGNTSPDVPSAYPPYGFGGGATYSTSESTYNDGGVGYIKIVYSGE